MSYLVIGPIVGVVLVIVLSLAGILISQTLGGYAPTVISQIHASATVVLLVTILARLESRPSKE
jgi:uncharacterized membrane protein YjjP (DUF1212 family)